MMGKIAAIAALALSTTFADAAEPVRVLVLGTYHFANPGLDIVNLKVDDVLLPERQAQIRAVVDGLAGFRPTRVVVEATADALPGAALPRYRTYLAGQGTDSRHEIAQIGFRLAQQTSLADVYGIDVDGEFPFEAVQNWAKANGREAAFQLGMNEISSRVKEIEAHQRDGSIGLALREMNKPEAVAADHDWYVGALRYGSGAEQPGAALLASWYTRNLGICARLVQLAKPGERIVVLYGAGHSFLLRHCVQMQPGWQLVEANDYLPR